MTSVQLADIEGDIRNLATLIAVTTNVAINVQMPDLSDQGRADIEEVQSLLWIARDLALALKASIRAAAGGDE